MKELVKLNLILSFRWKTFWLLSAYLSLLALARVVLLQFESDPVEVNLWDFLIQSQGGMKIDEDVQLWRYAGWVSSFAPLLFIAHQVVGLTDRYDLFLWMRSGSRFLWWNAKLLALILLAALYGTWFLLIHGLVGLCFFPFQGGWSPYYPLAFPELALLQLEPGFVLGMIWLVFVLGSVSVMFGILTLALFLKNTTHAYVVATALFFGSGMMYLHGWIPKKMALFFYPSLLDSFSRGLSSLSIGSELLSMNVSYSLVCVMVSVILMRKYPLS